MAGLHVEAQAGGQQHAISLSLGPLALVARAVGLNAISLRMKSIAELGRCGYFHP
jgi:hypothetical protein